MAPFATDQQQFRPLGRATPAVESTLGAAAAGALGLASAVRRKRIFHPDGVAFDAELDVLGGDWGAPLLDRTGRHRAVVRLSRGIGLPERFPDFLGVALRVTDAHGPDRHQDLLFVTSGAAVGARHALVPRSGFGDRTFSTLLPYRIGGESQLFGMVTAGRADVDLDELRSAAGPPTLRLTLRIATPTGPWSTIGTVTLGRQLPRAEADALRFDPSNTGGGIEPVGVVHAVRRLAYRASQLGRRAG